MFKRGRTPAKEIHTHAHHTDTTHTTHTHWCLTWVQWGKILSGSTEAETFPTKPPIVSFSPLLSIFRESCILLQTPGDEPLPVCVFVCMCVCARVRVYIGDSTQTLPPRPEHCVFGKRYKASLSSFATLSTKCTPSVIRVLVRPPLDKIMRGLDEKRKQLRDWYTIPVFVQEHPQRYTEVQFQKWSTSCDLTWRGFNQFFGFDLPQVCNGSTNALVFERTQVHDLLSWRGQKRKLLFTERKTRR